MQGCGMGEMEPRGETHTLLEGLTSAENTMGLENDTALRSTSSQHIGLEVEGLLSRPVTPYLSDDDIGRDSPNNGITCMDVEVTDAANSPSRMGPLNLKKWKRAARNKTDGVCNCHSKALTLGKRKGGVEEGEKQLHERGETKLKGICE